MMNNEGSLIAKEPHIAFMFNELTSSYESRLTLYNQGPFTLYFRIVSTFGRLLTLDNCMSKLVEPHKSIILTLKLKIPNQINKHHQIFRVSYSKKQISSKVHLIDDTSFDLQVKFDSTIPEEDPMITQILKADCEQLCQEAAESLKNGLVKKALCKELGSGLYGMAECLYLTESWNEALQEIETALILHTDQSYLWLKLKIVFEIIKEGSNTLQTIKGIKKQLQNITEVPNIEEKRKQMLEYLSKEEQKIRSERGGKYIAQLVEKALANYETDPTLKALYKSFGLYEKQLLEVLGLKNPHSIEQPPEYILDPISYQIMDQPLIVPSGHSFEQKSLLGYISKHGNKDLFTRQELRYEWARPNKALQDFIKKNQHLKQWKEYEKELGSFK